MKQQFIDVIEQQSQLDISTAPNYRTMVALAKHPEAYYPTPDIVAATIKINVNNDFVEDSELFELTINAYVKMLSRLYDQLKHDVTRSSFDSGPVADRMFMAMASEMSLTYTY